MSLFGHSTAGSPGPSVGVQPTRTWAALGAIMNVTNPLGSDEIEKSSEVEVRRNIRELARGQAEGDDVKTPADDLAALLRRMSDASTPPHLVPRQ